ncbi:hypothetical protein NKH77_08170 [Streptomyces sp. M19]
MGADEVDELPQSGGWGAGEVRTSAQDLSSQGRVTTQRSSGWPWRLIVSQYVKVAPRSGWCSTDMSTTSTRSPSAVTYERLRACSAGVRFLTATHYPSPRRHAPYNTPRTTRGPVTAVASSLGERTCQPGG